MKKIGEKKGREVYIENAKCVFFFFRISKQALEERGKWVVKSELVCYA